MIENGTLLQNRYLIEKQIGAGGMGAVYLAVDQRFGSHVAIKETFYTDEELGAAFEREARLLNGINHPSLPHVSDYFTENNNYFLVMQFIEGEDLSAILKRDGAFPVAKVRNWIDRLLDALEFLHSQQPPIIHRDIKPQNLKITPRGEVFLLDFGLAKLKSEEASSIHSVFGYSRKYSPLEQIQGTGTDARSDIFSLAATAYHLLTGKPPVDVLARASEIVAGRPDPLQSAEQINADVPIEFAAVLNTALALNADRRFASAQEMRQALGSNPQIETRGASVPLILPVGESGGRVDANGTNFPALKAFAENSADQSTGETASIVAPPANFQADARTVTGGVSAPNERFNEEIETSVSTARKNSRQPLIAAVIVIVLMAVLAAGYFAFRRPPAQQISETPTATETPAGNLPATAASPSNTSETAVLPEPEPTRSAANNGGNAVAEITDKKDSAAENVPIAETSAASAASRTKPAATTVNSAPKPAQSQPAARREPARANDRTDGETRDRIVEDEPIYEEIPQISPEERARRRRQRLRRQNELTEEEFQELRRDRRRNRRWRQTDNQIPY